MFKIRLIQSSSFPASGERISQVQDIFRQSFPSLAKYSDKIPSLLYNPLKHGYTTALFVAESSLGKINAFALLIHFTEISGSFLDYIAVRPGIRGLGLGGALYEAVREYCKRVSSKGLYMEVQPDDPELTTDPEKLKESKARIRFYEQYGARPIWNTHYSLPVGDPSTTAYLLYDALGNSDPLRKEDVKRVVKMIFSRRFAQVIDPNYAQKVLRSFKDDPVILRPFKYIKKVPHSVQVTSRRLDNPYALVNSPAHKIHHVAERGYFERPVRIDSLVEILRPLSIFTSVQPRNHGEKPILAVHDKEFVHYLRTVCSQLKTGRPVYPDTFPVRRPEKKPKELAIQAGYYCLDSGTPLYKGAYVGAIDAVNTTLTAADEILAGKRLAYAVCRPPGHHAGKKFYGGFCYFNNAAIAAHYLCKYAKVAILDIDYHHGNGTQDIFYDRNDILTVSIHGHPDHSYPYFSGYESETGEGKGLGYNKNFPLKRGTQDNEYLRILKRALTKIDRHNPEILVVSLGYDILKGDPTGTFTLRAQTFRQIAFLLTTLNIPLLVVQEGGYNIQNIRRGALAFFTGISVGL